MEAPKKNSNERKKETGSALNHFILEDQKYVLVDDTGRRLSEQKFEFVLGFTEGVAGVKDESGCYHVDRNGDELYARRFDDVQPFNIGQARVRLNGVSHVIDREGLYIDQGPYFV